jgi:hypothetical protein
MRSLKLIFQRNNVVLTDFCIHNFFIFNALKYTIHVIRLRIPMYAFQISAFIVINKSIHKP